MNGCGPHCGHFEEIVELEHMRSLIIAWAVAHDRFYSQRVGGTYPLSALHDAENALREAVGQ